MWCCGQTETEDRIENIFHLFLYAEHFTHPRLYTFVFVGIYCIFQFNGVEARDVNILLKSLSEYGSAGTDDLDSKVLNIAADYISGPVSHILNRCLVCGVYPGLWKEGKIIPLLKDNKLPFSGPNSRPISILPALSKIMEKIIHFQIQDFFNNNSLITKYQHAYRKSYSTYTALIEMTDDWLREIDNSKIVGVVMLDFSAAFDVIDHDILIQKLKGYGFSASELSFL